MMVEREGGEEKKVKWMLGRVAVVKREGLQRGKSGRSEKGAG